MLILGNWRSSGNNNWYKTGFLGYIYKQNSKEQLVTLGTVNEIHPINLTVHRVFRALHEINWVGTAAVLSDEQFSAALANLLQSQHAKAIALRQKGQRFLLLLNYYQAIGKIPGLVDYLESFSNLQ